MLQFAALLNELTTEGAEHFAQFLNKANSDDAARAGRWLASATPDQIKAAAALLNQGNLDEFRKCLGIGGRAGCAGALVVLASMAIWITMTILGP